MIKYYNLTQTTGRRMCYFRSTDIEQKNWQRLLWSVPDEMMYYLSRNKKIQIIDKSTKDKGKIEKIFVPVLNDLLNYIYFNQMPKNKWLKHHFNIAELLLKKDGRLLTKFLFWKRYVKKIDIEGKTIKVRKEKRMIE